MVKMTPARHESKSCLIICLVHLREKSGSGEPPFTAKVAVRRKAEVMNDALSFHRSEPLRAADIRRDEKGFGCGGGRADRC